MGDQVEEVVKSISEKQRKRLLATLELYAGASTSVGDKEKAKAEEDVKTPRAGENEEKEGASVTPAAADEEQVVDPRETGEINFGRYMKGEGFRECLESRAIRLLRG